MCSFCKDLIGERGKLEKELNESMTQNLKLNDKIKELERRCSEATSNMYDAKEKVFYFFYTQRLEKTKFGKGHNLRQFEKSKQCCFF